MTSATKTFRARQQFPPDFWTEAKASEQTLQVYVPSLLESAAEYFNSTAFTNITSAMDSIIHDAATFRESIQGALDAHNITLDTLTKKIETICMTAVHGLENLPTPDKAPDKAEREETIDKILDEVEAALLDLTARYEIDKQVVTAYLRALRPHLHALTVAVGVAIPPCMLRKDEMC